VTTGEAGSEGQQVRFIPYADKGLGKANIWVQPINGDSARQFTNWAPYPILFFDWSRDGKSLAYANGTMTSDVVIITDAR